MSPEENCTPVRIGIRVKVRVSFRVGSNQTIAPEENCPTVRVRVWLKVSFWVGGKFPRGQLSYNPGQLLLENELKVIVLSSLAVYELNQ